jgi:membrane protein YdbS with pleckstrin-like domain
MSYIKSVLQSDEQIIVIGRLHWIVYYRAIWYLIVGVIFLLLEYKYWDEELVINLTAGVFAALTFVSAIHAWFTRWTTEIAVTDRRVIYKKGFIKRHTVETNMEKVAMVDVNQSVLGRLLNYGTITVQGTGSSFEPLRRIEAPIELRNAIIAK